MVQGSYPDPRGPVLLPFLSSTILNPSPVVIYPPTLFLGLSLSKFSWQEAQRQLPLIGCVILLISLVISLILLCELKRGQGGFGSFQNGMDSITSHTTGTEGLTST